MHCFEHYKNLNRAVQMVWYSVTLFFHQKNNHNISSAVYHRKGLTNWWLRMPDAWWWWTTKLNITRILSHDIFAASRKIQEQTTKTGNFRRIYFDLISKRVFLIPFNIKHSVMCLHCISHWEKNKTKFFCFVLFSSNREMYILDGEVIFIIAENDLKNLQLEYHGKTSFTTFVSFS